MTSFSRTRMRRPEAAGSHPRRVLASALFLVFTFPSLLYTQVSGEIATISHDEAVAGTPLAIRAQVNQIGEFEHIFFRYRPFTSGEFVTLEMDLMGARAVALIPGSDVLPPFIDYYMIFVRPDGTTETNPPGTSPDPFTVPPSGTLQIPVRGAGTSSNVIFLSPETIGRTKSEDVVVAVSLLRTDSTIVRKLAQLWLDGIDVTDKTITGGDMMIFVPSNFGIDLSGGTHRLTVRLFDVAGKLTEEASHEFIVAGEGPLPAPVPPGFTYSGTAQAESRHEQISGAGTWYNRADIRLRGMMDEWTLITDLFVTSDEKPDRQPQNRFYIGAESPWLQAGYGDSYPIFPSLIMNGKRIRGFYGRGVAGPQVFMIAAGETNRKIEGSLLKTIPVDSLAVEQQRDPYSPYAPIDSVTWGKFDYGTYQRDLLVMRTQTRLGETGGIGLSVLKGKDNTSSITYGTRPQENLVVGLDFGGSFDDRRIEFSGEGAFSAFNSDISSGNFTDAYIDSTFSNPSAIKSARDVLDNFITVNDNLRPLSLDELSTLAYEFGVGLNYFRNALKAKYLYRGSDYVSFGQTFLRTDIQGFNISDRLSLSENQILLTLGFEHLHDNTSHFKVATTTFRNVNAALSYYPRTQGPSITVGFARYASSNGISAYGPDSLLSVDDVDHRAYIQSTYGFDWEAQHTASLNLSTSTRTDNSPRRFNVSNTTASGRLLSRFSGRLETSADLSLSLNTLPGTPGGAAQHNDYTTLSFSGIYRMMDSRLTFEARISPTFGDVDRTVWDGAVSYEFIPALILQMRFTYFANEAVIDDNVWRTTLRYDL